MVDSAYPLTHEPSTDIVLIYVGGDTPHPWTDSEIRSMPARYRWPCWVRSNPWSVNAQHEASLFVAWLHGHKVPMGTCVILDLETAVDGAFVDQFNLSMRAAGYKVTKYGSQSSIWSNPKTDGGTYLALPGQPQLTGEGDEVARQYAYDGTFDFSVVLDQMHVPLWDIRATAPPTIWIGSTGHWVTVAQQDLNRHGASPKLITDGIFGSKTEGATMAFQKAQRLHVDGIVGPLTWAALLTTP
jgi:hypothetical protein